MKLYEIPRAIEEALDMLGAADPETGEIIPDDAALAAYETANVEAADKVDATAAYLKGLDAEAAALKAEIARLRERADSAARKSERIKALLLPAVEALGGKVKGPRFSVSTRNTKAVQIVDAAALPEAFVVTKTETAPDKIKIKKAIEAGEVVPGAELEIRTSVSIR